MANTIGKDILGALLQKSTTPYTGPVDEISRWIFGKPFFTGQSPDPAQIEKLAREAGMSGGLSGDALIPVEGSNPPPLPQRLEQPSRRGDVISQRDDARLSQLIQEMLSGNGTLSLDGTQGPSTALSLNQDKTPGFSRASAGTSERAAANYGDPTAQMAKKLRDLGLPEGLAGLINDSQVAPLLEARRKEQAAADLLGSGLGAAAGFTSDAAKKEALTKIAAQLGTNPAQAQLLLELLPSLAKLYLG